MYSREIDAKMPSIDSIQILAAGIGHYKGKAGVGTTFHIILPLTS
jgi:hypothetical protein